MQRYKRLRREDADADPHDARAGLQRVAVRRQLRAVAAEDDGGGEPDGEPAASDGFRRRAVCYPYREHGRNRAFHARARAGGGAFGVRSAVDFPRYGCVTR